DLGDDDAANHTARKTALDDLRLKLDAALRGNSDDPILQALADTVVKYSIPHEYLFAALDGVEMDLSAQRYETFADLEQYCERVAAVVGQACIHIWGFRGPQALKLARRCGIAFQLTNILRDLKEDTERGRIYLPAEDLGRFDYSVTDLKDGVINPAFARLM